MSTFDVEGLHNTFVDISDNALDDVLVGKCDRIDVCLHRDGSLSVLDNGRGISPAALNSAGLQYNEDLFARLAPKQGEVNSAGRSRAPARLSGGELRVVAAVSEWARVTTWSDAGRLEIDSRRGETIWPLRVFASNMNRGMQVRWKPDCEIFPGIRFWPDLIIGRLQELAGINSGIITTFHDESSNSPDCAFHYPGGIQDYLKAFFSQDAAFHAPISFHAEHNDVIVDGAFQFHDGGDHNFWFYANTIPFTEGVPITSFKQAVNRAISTAPHALKSSSDPPLGSTIWRRRRPAVSCVMSIRLWDPEYSAATWRYFHDPRTWQPVSSAVYTSLTKALQDDPVFAKALLQRATAPNVSKED